ncbi:uncharacterized protein FSUBG_4913 [Fusarium subglutinans]|uniref:Uncharacterized protein n=1 Tax=Gibberella subglutinans TaxID=42677 RepID=A0A8H5V4M7_GIBSU|nr:uncharacterized protein FSUBG_4913 [Fusarium subglutinans]KAF5608089.1 hypothetical protein FSUBG_4913 [Fusarium subglutinans]
MSSKSIDLTGASPPTAGMPPPLVKLEQALLPATITQEQTSEQNPYFIYKKECRIAWIKYLGLLGRVKLREGLDRLPFFYGMPPENVALQIDPERLEMIQKAATSDPRNSLITLKAVLSTLRDRPQPSHIAWDMLQQQLSDPRAIKNFTRDRDIIKRWEALGSRNSMHLLNPAQASPEQATAFKEIQPSMLRLVGIQTNEEDPASSPGYVLSMASFERSIWKGEKASNEIERRQCANMALRSLQKFMDAQKNEAVIDKMVGFQKHYEALEALGLK